MEITAKTANGYLINATTKEVQSILTSVNGKLPDCLEIGQKIPAIDYASTIEKIKQLKNEYSYMEMLRRLEDFNKIVEELQKAIEKANDIEI